MNFSYNIYDDLYKIYAVRHLKFILKNWNIDNIIKHKFDVIFRVRFHSKSK